MTRLYRQTTIELPPHLAATAHRHLCPNGHEYPCYGRNHVAGSVRPCGSSASVCRPKATAVAS